MKKLIYLLLIIMSLGALVSAQTPVVDEPFNSGGLAYTWDDLRSVDDYLPKIVQDSTVPISDQDSDGYLCAVVQPAVSSINSYYVPGVSDTISDGKVTAWIYAQQTASVSAPTTDTVYVGVVGRSTNVIDPVSTYMYRCIWRTNNQLFRCQSYSSFGWHTVGETGVILTEGWAELTLQIQGASPPQVDGWEGTNHFATEADASTVETDLGTLWGFYAYTASSDYLYCDDVKIWQAATDVEDWDLY